jgi:hypothetical protein
VPMLVCVVHGWSDGLRANPNGEVRGVIIPVPVSLMEKVGIIYLCRSPFELLSAPKSLSLTSERGQLALCSRRAMNLLTVSLS